MNKIKLTKELIEQYCSKKITREEICNQLDMSSSSVYNCLIKKGIEIWDRKLRTDEELNKIISLYKNKKMTRNELKEKFKLSDAYLYYLLTTRKIEIWDKIRREKLKKSTTRFFNWKDYNNHYFFSYNK